ncbi:uncharacterized protein LOC113213100 isoform X2 [Frankliniella occidentalis]|uniref:Uncharacterized protein LOC113213100 isoform X2 n=1 Tax=Frankliniella occidentalis TaxID=133901 RepID=A0A9C6U6J3_FRAOC|nr:uncharacterized protein LOC113213100 isoform X2 [Frankliniella occidentalis]
MSSGRGGGLAVPGTSTSGASGAAVRRPARQTVDFSLKGPVHVTLDETPAGPPGCSVVDLLFAAPSQVSELVFHNYYTAWLTVLVRMLVAAPGPGPGPAPELGTPGQPQQTEQGQLQSGDAVPAVPAAQVQQQVQGDASSKLRKESGWVVAVARRVLMPSPHLETGSHDFVSILATESTVPWTELVAMRLVLRQPSPSWHTFHVEEIHVFAEPPRRAVWGRRHGPPAAAAVSSGSPAVGAGAAVGGAADQSVSVRLGPDAAPPADAGRPPLQRRPRRQLHGRGHQDADDADQGAGVRAQQPAPCLEDAHRGCTRWPRTRSGEIAGDIVEENNAGPT